MTEKEKKKTMEQKLAPFLIMVAGMLWGCMGLFVRTINEMGFTSMSIVSIRAIFTTILLGAFLLFYNKKLFVIHLKDIWCFLGTGLCSIVFFNYCYFKAIVMTSLSVAAVLLYTAPAFVMIMSYFLFHEQFTARKITALIMTFIGCICVTGMLGGTEGMNVTGILVGLGAGLGYAFYSIFSRFALERGYEPLAISFYTFLFATVGSLFFVDLKQIAGATFSNISMAVFVFVFAAVSTVIPYITYTSGLVYTENGKAAIIASVEPVVATILGVVIFHEKMTVMNIIGIIFVLGAIILCNFNNLAQNN